METRRIANPSYGQLPPWGNVSMMLAALRDPSTILSIAVAAIAGLLLFRANRYLGRSRQNRPEDCASFRSPKTGRTASEAPQSVPFPSPPHADGPPEVVNWDVHMHDTARELAGQLDSKMSALEALILEADRAAARLEAALSRSRDAGRQPGTQAERLRPAAAQEPAASDRADHAAPGRSHEEIYTLADYGFETAEIARRLGVPIGEVQLILGLRGKGKPGE
ncbi:MAG: hypothetical protein ABSG68_17830 [Thermoguttaceae bacterium]